VRKRGARPVTGGFTLLEVMVALTIGAMAVLGAAVLLSALGDRAAALHERARKMDFEGNAERTLREVAASLEVRASLRPSFVGDASSATFYAWCAIPAGWLSRCTVRLAFERDSAGSAWILRLVRGDTTVIPVRTGVAAGVLRYLVDPRAGGQWAEQWSTLVPPAAVALVADGDTLLVRLGSDAN
jgi:prepilin-type N-terminal cleavage/methylation domain-containing protein